MSETSKPDLRTGAALLAIDGLRLRAFFRLIGTEASGECWPWIGSKSHRGYGLYHPNAADVTSEGAHRTSYRWFVDASLLPSQDVHHVCGRVDCVNPRHLRALEKGEHAKEHRAARERVCANGHVIDEKNVVFSRAGARISRKCAICHRLKQRKYQQRLRAERAAAETR